MQSSSDIYNAGYANRATMQPSVGTQSNSQVRNVQVARRSKKRVGKAAKAGGRVAGRTVQVSGKAVGLGSKALMRGGAALSGTAVGAVIGVPMALAGAAGQVAGKGLEYSGKGIAKANSGKMSKRSPGKRSRRGKKFYGKGTGRSFGKKSDIKKVAMRSFNKVRARSVTMRIVWPLTLFYLWVQLPLTLIGMLMIGLKMGMESLFTKTEIPADAGFFSTLFSTATNALITLGDMYVKAYSTLIEFFTGVDVTSLFDPMTLFGITYLIFVPLVLFKLFAVGIIYKLSGVEPLGDKGSFLKWGTLLLAFLGYLTPVVNIIPWIAFWILAIFIKQK